MRKRRLLPRVVLPLLVVGAVAFGFRQGLVPAWLSPLPAIDLSTSNVLLVDWRLAEIRYNPGLCRAILQQPQIEARPIPDNPLRNGCGWVNAVSLSKAGDIHSGYDKVTCEAAVALSLWLIQDVQPLAQEILGTRVTGIRSFGSYSCRNIIGNPFWRKTRSEHATANAVDIGGFSLADGRQISIERSWRGSGKEAEFLHAVHSRACRYFRVALGPDYNAAHSNHFHLDRGFLSRCK